MFSSDHIILASQTFMTTPKRLSAGFIVCDMEQIFPINFQTNFRQKLYQVIGSGGILLVENGQKEIGEEVTTHITGERRQRKIMGDGKIFQTQKEQLFPFSQTRDNSEYLKVASVFVKWVVAEVHQAGDLDGDLDVEGDPLRSRDSQPSHLIENVVLLELLKCTVAELNKQLERIFSNEVDTFNLSRMHFFFRKTRIGNGIMGKGDFLEDNLENWTTCNP